MKRSLLVILDLNGTLLDRVQRGGQSTRSSLLGLRSTGGPRKADFKHLNKLYYFRPHMKEFLTYLFSTFQVGIWTSALPNNVYPMLTSILGGALDVSQTLCDHSEGDYMGLPSTQTQAMDWSQRVIHLPNDPSFDWMDPSSVRSPAELALRSQLVFQVEALRKALEEKTPSETAPRWPLRVLWTQRRCILRRTCPEDSPGHHPDKPVAIKDLSQLWSCPMTPDQIKTALSSVLVGEQGTVRQLPSLIAPSPIASSPIVSSPIAPSPFYLPSFPSLGPVSSPSSTLLIENSVYKYALQPLNGIAIPEYSVSSSSTKEDAILLRLIEYLERFRNSVYTDIRDYVQAYPTLTY